MIKFLLLRLKNKSKVMLHYSKLYLLIFFFILSFNSIGLAQDNSSINEKEIEGLVENKRVSFFYLLGASGKFYNKDTFAQAFNPNAIIFNGFAIELIGGWQANKYFAMEIALRYKQSYFGDFDLDRRELTNIDLKYTLLFQPYLEINKSWSIMPKIGAGMSWVVNSKLVSNNANITGSTLSQTGMGFSFFGTVGVRAAYKKFMFGISYELGRSSIYYPGETVKFTEHRILAEAGIKF